jgi:NitT/TauT family transport system permease protein
VKSTRWGLLVGVSTGFVTGLVLGRNDRLVSIFEPHIIAFNSLPRIALVPLITMIFGSARGGDDDRAHDLPVGATEEPLAWTFASLTPSISFALIGVVVGEFLGGESGGGFDFLIIQSLGTLNAADLMVALIALGVIGFAMALGIKQIEKRLLRWRPEYRSRT